MKYAFNLHIVIMCSDEYLKYWIIESHICLTKVCNNEEVLMYWAILGKYNISFETV
jgi:hypothetical protein